MSSELERHEAECALRYENFKDQFKTVLLISHLESLKDIVDMTIDIDKIDGYAKVDLEQKLLFIVRFYIIWENPI